MTLSLEVFQTLSIPVEESGRDALAAMLILHAKAPWRHVSKASPDQRQQGNIVWMERSATDDLPAARLMLWPTESGYTVSNVVPTEIQELTTPLYNEILQEFAREVASPAASSVGCTVSLTKPTQSPDDWFDPSTVGLLASFCNLANKATGASHPLDAMRWQDFLISAHRGGQNKVDSDLLLRWLVEVERFPEDIGEDLALQYSFAIDLLRRYDGVR